MKNWYTYIIMLATVLFGSCNLEDTLFPEQECENGKKDVNVRLILSMMGGDGVSRALTDSPTEDYLDEEPLGNEYYINPYDVEVLIFTCGDKPENSYFVERATMVRASKTEYYKYQLDGTLSEIEAETPYRIVVLANMHGSCYTTGGNTLTKDQTTMKTYLESLTYTGYTTSFTTRMLEENSTERIPMWGATASYLEDGTTISLDLLRAMAKVKVKMAKSLEVLSAVTLEFANPGGYVTPLIANVNVDETTATNANGVSAIANDAETKTITGGNTQRVRTPRIPTGLTLIDSFDLAAESTLSFSDVSSTDNYEYVIYIPEYKNLGIEATPARMKLTIGGKPYKLEFKDYSKNNTEYFDIIRNYYYLYTITGVSTGNEPSLTVSVQNWNLNQETLSFQDYVSVGTDGQIAWFKGNNTEGTPITPEKSNSGDKAYVYSNTKDSEVTCTFNISTPVGGTWYASLIGSGEDTFAFEFNDASQLGTDNEEYAIHTATMATGKVGMGPITLTIKTVSDRPKLVNNEAILQIYVETYDRRTIAVKELLNKEVYSGIDMCTLIQIID